MPSSTSLSEALAFEIAALERAIAGISAATMFELQDRAMVALRGLARVLHAQQALNAQILAELAARGDLSRGA